MDWTATATAAVVGFNYFVLGYALALNGIQLVLLSVATVAVPRILGRERATSLDDVYAHPGTPGVSILVPAYNEAAGIIEAVQSLLRLRYPSFELVVVDDGSTDDTFGLLQREFGLVPVDRVVEASVPTQGAVTSVYIQASGGPLVVVRKVNAQRRSDALNAAINVARHDYICMIDGDCVLEPDALLHTVKPFLDNPSTVVGVGGVIRPANGAGVRRGQVTALACPRSLVARIQVVEYLRAFLVGRVGWTQLQGVLIISGAFGVFRRATVVELGGLSSVSLGEDAELVATLHHRLRRLGADYRLVVVPQPVCWTEVPETLLALGRQRRRWSTGLAQVLMSHRGALFNPRYGRFGLVVLPYYLCFELLSPVVEIAGLIAVPLALALGLIDPVFAMVILLASVGFGLLLSLAAIVVEEVAFHRHDRLRDLGRLVLAAALENIGFRQLHAWWRLRGLLDAMSGREIAWGTLPRTGFTTTP